MANLEHELGGQPVGRGGRRKHHRLLLRRVVVGRRVLARGEDAARLHQLQDVVSALDDRRIGWHDQVRLPVGPGLLHGVLDQVEVGGGLRDRREDGRLRQGQLAEIRDAPVAAGGCRHPVAAVAVEVLVEVGGDDLLLARDAGELLGQPDRLDDLADLPLERGARERGLGQEPRPHQLLGDRRGAARIAGQGIQARGEDPGGIEAGVLPERLVLGGRRRVDEDGRDLVVRDDVALLAGKGGELDLAGPVQDPGLLGEVEVVEDHLRVRKALAVVAERGHRSREPDDARDEKRGEQEDGEGDGDPRDIRITGRALP